MMDTFQEAEIINTTEETVEKSKSPLFMLCNYLILLYTKSTQMANLDFSTVSNVLLIISAFWMVSLMVVRLNF